ncbi:response regulator transcription factor [Fictibacillus aquaticus]|uniref:DNA-binding response regulator n=1 Tax=Fictibacillus aquaticus TaxID=2021314 RepID=A0A235FE46_9BACL|nr:response regulator transcription factor [Fictibacillus aquaticus]OYD59469.1 DNA-binding response regulator [Fictibacillus aquaticus]
MKTILVAEDEASISAVLKAYLTNAGYKVVQAFDGDSAVKQFQQSEPALAILDVMMPSLDGWQVLKRIRENSTCPVIMLTALSDVSSRLAGLNGGADDYIAKPFIGEEVIARVHAVLRRTSQHQNSDEDQKSFGRLRIDWRSHAVYLNGIAVELTPRDLSLLLYLARHPNRTFTRDILIEQVWGLDYFGSDRAVDLSIKRIRKSLENWPEEEGEIKTLRGVGYRFSVS